MSDDDKEATHTWRLLVEFEYETDQFLSQSYEERAKEIVGHMLRGIDEGCVLRCLAVDIDLEHLDNKVCNEPTIRFGPKELEQFSQ
jgi:hypothetical protein